MSKWMWLIALTVCLSLPAVGAAAPIQVFVSIQPQKYFVEKIGGDLVDVHVMVPTGANPHNYEPKPVQMTALTKAKAYLAIGITFENIWLDRIASANKDMAVAHTEEGIEKIPMSTMGHHDHDEGDEAHHDGDEHEQGDHDHGTLDPHIWTSPYRVKTIAHNTMNALVRVDPGNEAAYKQGYRSFLAELDALDSELKEIFQGKKSLKFMVFHPAWGYLAHDYGLVQIPVEVEGKEPKPAQLKEIIVQARKEGIKVLFVQPQLSTRSAETIAREIGGQVVKADPLAENWGQNLKEQAEKFKAAFN